jgi:DNA-binding transcriptional LysR family regulator
MDVRRLELLRELSERGSVTAVAAATRRTPSAVSQQLKQLEREAGIALTERRGRGIALTAAGRALARTAAEVTTAIEHAEAIWDDYVGTPRGEVTLLVFQTAGTMLVPGMLHAIAGTPGLEVRCTDTEIEAVDFASLTPDYDIVLTDSSGIRSDWDDRGLLVVPLMREPLDIALPVGHRLARRRSVAPADLVGEPWIGVPVDQPFDVMLGQIEAANGTPAHVVQRFQDNAIVEAMVAAGHGIAILPRFTTPTEGAGIVMRPLTGVRASRVISALLRPDRAERQSVRLVLDALRAEGARMQAAQAGHPGGRGPGA